MMNKKLLVAILVLIFIVAIVVFLLQREASPPPVASSTPDAEIVLPATPGLPTNPSENILINYDFYSVSYDEAHEQPDWVMYKLVGDSLDNPKFKRRDNFRADKNVATGSATPSDYKKSGYDRGHLAPAADMSWSKEALSETFYMTNMSPQKPGFNRGIWKELEEQVRDWAMESDELYVVTGPVLKGKMDFIGKNEVAVPKLYYKIILDYKGPDFKAVAFVMSNEKHDDPLQNFVVSIDSVESLTGLNFFGDLPDSFEESLENVVTISNWFPSPEQRN
mgnify:CR=1 FL=1